jgi:glycosyltransferase involved in cell wall biosynthesis
MNKHKISVIIPCHNNHRSLKWILKAISISSEYICDVICVDDASLPGISDITEKYGAKYVRLPGNIAGRRSLARNIGHIKSKGEISFYIDGDVIPEPRLFKTTVDVHLQNPDSVIKYPVYSIREKNHQSFLDVLANYIIQHDLRSLGPFVTKNVGIDTRPVPKRIRGKKTNIWQLCASHCTSVLKEHVEKVGGWDESFKGWGEEDLELAYRLFKSGITFIYPHRKFGAAYHLDHPFDSKGKLKSLNENLKYFKSKFPESWETRIGLLKMYLAENNFPEIEIIKDNQDR